MHTVVWPVGPHHYDVTVGTKIVIGQIWARMDEVTIDVIPGSILEGISPGPYASLDDAMIAIADHVKGTCELGQAGHP